MITEEQEQHIIRQVEDSRIKNQLLRDDLVDHLCCLTEVYMNKGMMFERAMEEALLQTAPTGLNEIEKETIFLLNYSKIMFMKRLTYVLGYLFAVTWVAGILFKLLNFAGAGLLLGIGGIGLAFIFLPLFLIGKYKNLAHKVISERMKWIFGGASLVLLIASISMKFLHLMGAPLMLAISFFVFGFGFLPSLFFTMYRKSVNEL